MTGNFEVVDVHMPTQTAEVVTAFVVLAVIAVLTVAWFLYRVREPDERRLPVGVCAALIVFLTVLLDAPLCYGAWMLFHSFGH